MVKSKGTRAEHATKHTKEKPTATDEDQSPTLENQAPHEYFPLLKLPRELRDEILDNMANQSEIKGNNASAPPLPIIGIRVSKHAARRKMTTVTSIGWHSCGSRTGVFAMPAVSKQVRKEFQESVSRAMPHHFHTHLLKTSARNRSIKLRLEHSKHLPTKMRRLYIKNTSDDFDPSCDLYRESVQSPLLAGHGLKRLRRYLQSCTKLTELVIDFCLLDGEHVWYDSGSCTKLADAVLTVVESLPKIRQALIRTCEQKVHWARVSEPTVNDAAVSKADGGRVLKWDGEADEFLNSMGVPSYGRRTG